MYYISTTLHNFIFVGSRISHIDNESLKNIEFYDYKNKKKLLNN